MHLFDSYLVIVLLLHCIERVDYKFRVGVGAIVGHEEVLHRKAGRIVV